MEVALLGENYDMEVALLWRWHCGERTMEVALWGENYEGGTVGRELWRWHCGERTMEMALWGENRYGGGTVGREL